MSDFYSLLGDVAPLGTSTSIFLERCHDETRSNPGKRSPLVSHNLSLGLASNFFTVAAAVNLTSELTSSSMRNGRGPDLIIVDSPLDLDHGITGPQK